MAMPDWKAEIKGRLAGLRLLPEREAAIVEELSQHLNDCYAELLAGGATAAEACRRALAELSDSRLLQQELRRVERQVAPEPVILGTTRRRNMITDLWQDLRFGARMLMKNPGFTGLAVLTLALGIGANSTIFSLINALLLRPLPVERPEELAALYTSDFSSGDFGTSSYPDYIDFRDRSRVLAGLAAYTLSPLSLNVDGANERAFGEIVSGNYFAVLGVKLALGRGFLPEEDKIPGAHPVAVISHRLWQERFGGEAGVVGRSIGINGHPFTVVGVAEAGYAGLLRGLVADLWVPAMMMKQAMPGGDDLVERGNRSFFVVGRLQAGATIEQAQAEFRGIAAQLFKEWPQQWSNIRSEGRAVSLLPESEARVMPGMRTPLVLFMALLMAVVGLVLLIACANVANLLLARASVRRKEIAIRLALGAGRGRLLRQLLTESLLLAVLSGVGGLLLAVWGGGLLMAFKPPVPVPIEIDLGMDWRVLGFNFGVALLTGVLFGLAPALAASRSDLVGSLKDESSARGRASGRGRLRGALVVVQVALSLLLLIGSGLFLRSLRQASSIDPGFDADNLLVLAMDLQLQGYDEAAGRNFSQAMLERVRALPGVEAASLAESLPLGLGGSRRGITIEGYTAQPGESTEVQSSVVAPGYLETLRIPVLRGRTFNETDREGAPGVVVVNEAFAERYWPGQDPLGKRIQMGSRNNERAPYLEVIGVTKDGKYVTLGEAATPFFYLNLAQRYQSSPTLIVRTRGNPLDHLAAVRSEIAGLDRNLPLFDVKTMRQHLGVALLPARLAGSVLGVFGMLALILAAAGIYGVMAYAVAQRRREIGIRMALGARSPDVLKLVVGQGMKLVGIGVAIGLGGALALTRLMTSLLYEVSATDPATFLAITVLLAGVALAACWIPARRATKVDPMIALRCE